MNAPYGQIPLYGAAPLSHDKHTFLRLHGSRLNLVGILKCFFLPWLLFVGLSALFAFYPYFTHPVLCRFVAACCLFLIVNTGMTAYGVAKRKREGTSEQEPTWHIFLCVSLLVALIGGVTFGESNFRYNMQPYYEYQHLSAYPNVSTTTMTGDQFMDFGRLQFNEGTTLDLTKSMGFRNVEMYCVAPIVSQNAAPSVYDFWAVGMNCCSGTADFRCGEFSNSEASAGLRLLSEADRDFYRLAMQQAESTFNIRSRHPVFVHWVEDAKGAINQYWRDGRKYFLISILGYFCLQLVLVLLVTNWSSKLGRY